MSKTSGLGLSFYAGLEPPAGGPFIRHAQASRSRVYEARKCSYCQAASSPPGESCRVCGAPDDTS